MWSPLRQSQNGLRSLTWGEVTRGLLEGNVLHVKTRTSEKGLGVFYLEGHIHRPHYGETNLHKGLVVGKRPSSGVGSRDFIHGGRLPLREGGVLPIETSHRRCNEGLKRMS